MMISEQNRKNGGKEEDKIKKKREISEWKLNVNL